MCKETSRLFKDLRIERIVKNLNRNIFPRTKTARSLLEIYGKDSDTLGNVKVVINDAGELFDWIIFEGCEWQTYRLSASDTEI